MPPLAADATAAPQRIRRRGPRPRTGPSERCRSDRRPILDAGVEKPYGSTDIFAAGRPSGVRGKAVRHGHADATGARGPQPYVVIERRVRGSFIAPDESTAVNKDDDWCENGAGGRDKNVHAVAWIWSVHHIAMHCHIGSRLGRERRHQRHRGLDLGRR